MERPANPVRAGQSSRALKRHRRTFEGVAGLGESW